MARARDELGRLVRGTTDDATKMTRTVSGASDAITKMADGFGSSVGGIKDGVASMKDFVSTTRDAGGVLPMITNALSALGPEGQAAAAVLQVVTAAVTALVVTLYDWLRAAVLISQEKDALSATFAALSDGATAGRELVDSMSEVAAQLPFAEGRTLAWAKSLMAAGIQGEAAERAVRAIASATALMGDQGGAAAETLIKRFAMMSEIGGKVKLDRRILSQLAQAGISASTLAKALGVDASKLSTMAVDASKLADAMQTALIEKGAGALEAMGATWDSITSKLSDSWEDLWEDMGTFIQPFMMAVRDLFAEFSAGSTAQSTAKGVLTAIFRELFEAGTKAVRAIHHGFLIAEIAALKFAIAVAPIVNFFRRIFSDANVLAGLAVMFKLLLVPVVVIGGALLAIVAILGVLAAAASAAYAVIVAGIAWVAGSVANAGASVGATLSGWATTAQEAAADFVAGLVAGITAGAAAVVGAVTGLASSALGAFKATLGIKSPSVVMRAQGMQVAAGAALGIEAGAPRVQAASANLGLGAASGAASGGRGAGGGGRALQVTFAPGSIVIDGAGKSAMEITEEMLALVFERLAAKEGLVTP